MAKSITEKNPIGAVIEINVLEREFSSSEIKKI